MSLNDSIPEGLGTSSRQDMARMTPREFWRSIAEKHGVSPDKLETAFRSYDMSKQMGHSTTGHQSAFARSLVQTFITVGCFGTGGPEKCARALAARRSLPLALHGLKPDAISIERIGRDKCKQFLAVPIHEAGPARPDDAAGAFGLILACADPDMDGFKNFMLTVQRILGPKSLVDIRVARLDEVISAIDRSVIQESVSSVELAGNEDVIDKAMVERDLYSAFRRRASDFHLECTETGASVRIRVDGRMREFKMLNAEQRMQYVAQVKLSSGRANFGYGEGGASAMDSGDNITAQDAVSARDWDGCRVVLRYSGGPSKWGYSVVVRFINQTSILAMRLSDLGYRRSVERMLVDAIEANTAMSAFCGTTGSGKSTSLYCLIKSIDLAENKVITVEDPIEVAFSSGVDQHEVTQQMPFHIWLRYLLRQDPDILIPGEVRDHEVFKVTVQGAQSGHTVFTTVHVDTPFEAVQRFMGWASEPGAFASLLNVFCAQRLAPRLCLHCRVPSPENETLKEKYKALMTLHADDLEFLLLDIAKLPAPQFFDRSALGCHHCEGKGTRGRIVLSECHKFNAADKALMYKERQNYNSVKARQLARKPNKGLLDVRPLVTMREDAILKAAAGIISMEGVFAYTEEDLPLELDLTAE